jgi:uncharacterized small protein (TIGR04563 family)
MVGSDRRKQSLHFSESPLREIKHEAERLDRSISWVVQAAWKTARRQIKSTPSSNDVAGSPELLAQAGRRYLPRPPPLGGVVLPLARARCPTGLARWVLRTPACESLIRRMTPTSRWQ